MVLEIISILLFTGGTYWVLLWLMFIWKN